MAEFQKMLPDLQLKLRDLKFDLYAGKVKNVAEIRDVKKTIARIKTWMKQESLKVQK